MKNNKGITLMALIITIIVMLILAAITISMISSGGIIGRANEAKFKTKMQKISEELFMYNAGLEMEGKDSKINAGEVLKEIITQDGLEIDQASVQDISKILTSVGKTEEQYCIVLDGDLYYVSQDKIDNNEKQTKWCEDIGIKVYAFAGKPEGIQIVNGNYELVNGVYLCTPQLNMGLEKDKTRYVKLDKKGNMSVGNWINKKPDADWYDYKSQNWANICVESDGLTCFYVWIPRYCYKVDSKSQRTDVKFINLQNEYIDESGNQTSWEDLQTQGYKLPEAFNFNNKDLPGYWISKYQLNELGSYPVNFDVAAGTTSMTIQNIATATQKTIKKYTYAINGKIVHESKKAEDYKITGLARGNKTINVTALDENGEIVGSFTKKYEVAETNVPDVSQFDPDTTFYVYWDEDGKEHNEVPISRAAPSAWYDYTTANWANVVTRNNGLEAYFVWIPRYAYALNSTSQRSYIKFLKGTTRDIPAGYKIPEAFTFNGTELTGYWVSKYQLAEGTAKVNAEISAGSNSLIVGDISNSTGGTPTKIEYYLNGDKVNNGTSLTEHYAYSGLKANTQYTINIILRDAKDNFVGAVTKKVKTSIDVTPDLTGFEKDKTFYVYYDADGTEHSDIPISESAPNNWYDYATQNWANIVVKANDKVSYFTWIPRYEYAITDADKAKQRTEVVFVTTDTTNENCTTGYKVPEAFTFNKKELRGYWISKYQLVEK